MEPKNEQHKSGQATNDQPKKTWVEPELLNLDVEGGNVPNTQEATGNLSS